MAFAVRDPDSACVLNPCRRVRPLHPVCCWGKRCLVWEPQTRFGATGDLWKSGQVCLGPAVAAEVTVSNQVF